MKILEICCSPRKGNTEWLMRKLMTAAEKKGAKTELITLKDRNIKACDGCLACEKTNACHIKDDMQGIYDKMLSADVVVLGSPDYMDAPTASAMNFIHRMYPLYGKIKGKRFASVIVGQLAGADGIASQGKIEDYFKSIARLFGLDYRGSISVQLETQTTPLKSQILKNNAKTLSKESLK